MNYERLLLRVLNTKQLVETANDFQSEEENVFNLLTMNWRREIKSRFSDQEVKFNKVQLNNEYYKLEKLNDTENILVFGRFRLYENRNKLDNSTVYNFNCIDCPPLKEITDFYISDCDQSIKDNQRLPHFTKRACAALICPYCSNPSFSIRINLTKDWCIASNMMFNGREICNVYQQDVVSNFLKRDFLAIMLVSLRGRMFTGPPDFNKVKITGEIKNMILFTENAFKPEKALNMARPLPSLRDECDKPSTSDETCCEKKYTMPCMASEDSAIEMKDDSNQFTNHIESIFTRDFPSDHEDQNSPSLIALEQNEDDSFDEAVPEANKNFESEEEITDFEVKSVKKQKIIF